MKTRPLVSVTIPAYNNAATLGQTIDCVLAQTYPNIEMIIVDDGSTDDTQKVIERYRSKVRCVRKDNGGLASARNAGLREARGEYIALLDADDLCAPERIDIQVAVMESNTELVLCGSDFSAFNERGTISDSYLVSYYKIVRTTNGGLAALFPERNMISVRSFGTPMTIPPTSLEVIFGNIFERLILGNFIHPPTVLFRRDILGKCGLLDENFSNICDYDWLVRVSRIGKIGLVLAPLLNYRISDQQMSGERNRSVIMFEIIQFIEKLRHAYPDFYAMHAEVFRRRTGSCYLAAADALSEEKSCASIASLFHSFAHGEKLHPSMFRILGKLILPTQLLRWYRSVKKSTI